MIELVMCRKCEGVHSKLFDGLETVKNKYGDISVDRFITNYTQILKAIETSKHATVEVKYDFVTDVENTLIVTVYGRCTECGATWRWVQYKEQVEYRGNK